VTPEAARYLTEAREDLHEARQIFAINLAMVAARSAYYAAFHAAEAFIVETTGRVAKTHNGVRSEFARLVKDNPVIPRALTTFLAQSYEFKEVSDYSVDPNAAVTMANAESAIRSALELVEVIEAALG
jgi:uncharacterized protein (UPF0332 family)